MILFRNMTCMDYQCIRRFVWEIDSDDESLKMPRAVSIQDKQSGLRYEVLKIFSVTEKSRSGKRIKFKAFVGCGDNVTKIGLGVSIAKSRVEAIN